MQSMLIDLLYDVFCHSRSYSLSGSETSNKPKRIPIRSASSLNVTSRQFKDHATGRFLSTDIDYLETTAYSIFKAKTESKEVSRIAGDHFRSFVASNWHNYF